MALTANDVLALLHDRLDRPATVRELMTRLSIPKQERVTFRRLVKSLIAEGKLVTSRDRYVDLPARAAAVRGRLVVHPQGFAFVVPDGGPAGQHRDIHVPAHLLGDAVHGDRVEAQVERAREDGRSGGRIVRVLHRRAPRIVGRARVDRAGLLSVEPIDRRLLWPIRVVEGGVPNIRSGDVVVVDVIDWPARGQGPTGRLVTVLGDERAPGVDTRIVMIQHGLVDEHTDAAMREAGRLGTSVDEADCAGRTDFRGEQVVTIDGEHARDFDDAVSVEELPGGSFRLTVHIADVAHYVRPDSALDREAAARATSVYFPERALHMFPAALATGLCSLNSRVDRLVQSVRMVVGAEGDVLSYELHDGVICSAARLTYAWVNAVLLEQHADEPDPAAPLIPHLRRMARLFEVLNARRRRRGSIDFDLPEPDFVLDDEGRVAQILVAERNIAHRLIEEFMLLANETVAAHLTQHDVSSLFRVHERPDPLKVAEFEAFIAALGHTLGAEPESVSPRHFQQLVSRVRGRPEERAVALLMLRTMQKARYDPADLGHFGLATSHYLHFTSPIRRYPDLVVHRTLRWLRQAGAEAPPLVALADRLPELATHTSEMERRADDAERELVQWKKVRFMADKVGETFEGVVVGVVPFGLFVELVEHFVEGLVHVSTLVDDHYQFVERAHVLVGDVTGRRFRLGDRLTVRVLRVDHDRRQMELGVMDVLERRPTRVGPGGRKGRPSPVFADKNTRAGRTRRATAGGGASKKRVGRPGRRERNERKKDRGRR